MGGLLSVVFRIGLSAITNTALIQSTAGRKDLFERCRQRKFAQHLAQVLAFVAQDLTWSHSVLREWFVVRIGEITLRPAWLNIADGVNGDVEHRGA